MFCRILGIVFIAILTVRADEAFPSLKVKSEVYTNVTVRSVTPTDIYFMHAGGLASAKLKDLDASLQKHFHFDAAKAGEVEKAQVKATADFRTGLAQEKSTSKPADTKAQTGDGDFVTPRLYARSFRGQAAPKFVVETWISDEPDTKGKFVLIDFWATWCGPCRRTIPLLNSLQKKFADQLAVIGVSDESEEDVRKHYSSYFQYAIAIDTKQRMYSAVQGQAIPHCLLVDPAGIVRYEGSPAYLNEQIVQHLLDKYSK